MWFFNPLVLAVLTEQMQRNKEDVSLLERIQRRDEQSLAKLYDRYAALLYTLAFRIVSTQEESEDIVQEAFLQVWNKANSYIKDRGTVYSWITTLTRNKAIDRVRSKRYKQQSKETRLDEIDKTPATHSPNPHQTVVLKEYQEIVTAAQKKLSSIEAKILELSYYGGYSQAEIAQILKMPLGTVKTKMRQGIIKLRQLVRQGASAT